MSTDWYAWHTSYDELESPPTRLLAEVQEAVRSYLDAARPGALRVVSLASGQARELLPLLIEHPRGRDVLARLVDLDPRNVDVAEGAALGAALPGVEVVCGDAGCVDVYAGAVPADLVLACGLFDNITHDEVHATVRSLPQLCAAGATVLWTHGREQNGTTGSIRSWLAEAGFTDVSVRVGGADNGACSVGTARWNGPAGQLCSGTRMFSLV